MPWLFPECIDPGLGLTKDYKGSVHREATQAWRRKRGSILIVAFGIALTIPCFFGARWLLHHVIAAPAWVIASVSGMLLTLPILLVTRACYSWSYAPCVFAELRKRGYDVCTRCGYPLNGLETCSECGTSRPE